MPIFDFSFQYYSPKTTIAIYQDTFIIMMHVLLFLIIYDPNDARIVKYESVLNSPFKTTHEACDVRFSINFFIMKMTLSTWPDLDLNLCLHGPCFPLALTMRPNFSYLSGYLYQYDTRDFIFDNLWPKCCSYMWDMCHHRIRRSKPPIKYVPCGFNINVFIMKMTLSAGLVKSADSSIISGPG